MNDTIPAQAPSSNTVVDMGALLNRLLYIDYIPQDIRDYWWILTSDDVVLSKHNEKDIAWLMLQFDLLELETIRSLQRISGKKYSTDVRRIIRMIRIVYFARLNRGKEGFERETQATQIYSNITQEPKPDPTRSTGFLANVKRFVTGGG